MGAKAPPGHPARPASPYVAVGMSLPAADITHETFIAAPIGR